MLDTIYFIKKALLRTTGLVILVTFFSRAWGYVATIVIAARFGASRLTDMYLISLIVPELLIILLGASLGFVLTPVFTEYLAKGRERQGWQFIYTGSMSLAAIFIFSFVVVFIFSQHLSALLAPRFDLASRNTLSLLIRIACGYMFFAWLTYIPRSILHAYRRFIIPAVSPAVLQMMVIASILLFYKKLHIYSVVIGLGVGALICFFWQVLSLRDKIAYFDLKFSWSQCRQNTRRILVLLYPVFLYSIIGQVNGSVDRVVAALFPSGSVAALDFAFRVYAIFWPVFAGSFFTVLLPLFSERVTLQDWPGFNETVSFALRVLLFLLTPVSIFMMFMARPVIAVLFQRGAFDALATDLTAGALIAYTLSLSLWACAHIGACGLLAFKDTKTVGRIGFMLISLNLILDLILSRYFAHIGIALGTSIVNIFSLWIYLRALQRKIGLLNLRPALFSFLKFTVISLVCILPALFGYQILITAISGSAFINQLTRLAAALFIFIILYLGLCVLMRVDELKEVYRLIRAR